ncbi:hypothetical protein [Streptomyces sannanensis]|uniref:hypothetical protein n=1 Tax=Streptomyces sannanensis TaxID=285536 RepID=UPI0031E8A5AE
MDAASGRTAEGPDAPSPQHPRDAKVDYDSAEPGWRAGVEWTLLWIEILRRQRDRGQA